MASSKTAGPDQTDDSLAPQHPHDEENPLPPVIGNKEANPNKEDDDLFLVGWDPDEKANPRNWSNSYKSWITFQLGMLALAASLGSSIISPAEESIANYTGISTEVAVLVISAYILG